MNKDLINAIEQIGVGKNINKKVLVEALESALITSARKVFGSSQNIRIDINADKGEFKIFSKRKVVEVVANETAEIELDKAKKINPEANIGDEVEIELPTERLGRIAAQTAKQVVLQRVKDVQRDNVFDEFKSKEGDVLSSAVLRTEGKDVIVDVGDTEALLPYNEQMFKETLRNGNRIKVYCLKVNKNSREYQVVVSRTHPGLLKRLLEIEVPEIANGVIEIKSVAREPGYRAKVAVISKDKNVDPIGSCIGVKGNRIQSITKELQGEKIDVIEWNEDPKVFIATALSPADVLDIQIDENERKASINVLDSQLSLAIGKKGQNARLTAKLTGWKIDIKSETRIAEDRQKSIELLSELKTSSGVSDKIIEKLIDSGFFTPAIIAEADIANLVKLPGIGKKIAEKLKTSSNEIIKRNSSTSHTSGIKNE